MSEQFQFGCKKCGGVVTVDARSRSDRVEFRLEDGKIKDRRGAFEIHCKKCSKAVAFLSIEQA